MGYGNTQNHIYTHLNYLWKNKYLCPPQVQMLKPQYNGILGWGLSKLLGHKDGALMNGIRIPGGSYGKEPAWQFRRCKRHGFVPWVGKTPWRREWLQSCCISLCALFAEPRVGKVWAKRLEEDLRSCRTYRHIYSVLVDAAAITVDTLYVLLSWLTQRTQPWHSSNAAAF